MDKAVKQSADLMTLIAWADANRKRLLITVGAVLAVGAIVGLTVWHKRTREADGNEAISKLTAPSSLPAATAADADAYLKVANEFAGTKAGARALIMAAEIQFDIGKFRDAQQQFERFLADYSDNPVVSVAALGVAASLEAQGKPAEATTRYEEMLQRRGGDGTTPQVRASLARLYLAQNNPEKALRQYEELLMARNQDSWTSQAVLQREELLDKYPNLRKPVAPPPLAPMLTPSVPQTSTSTNSAPVLLNPTNTNK